MEKNPIKESLSQKLEQLQAADSDHRISVGEMLDTLGDKSFGILLLLLAMPSALPLPAPGYSTPLGILIALLSLQMIMGRHQPWLAEWARKKEFKHRHVQKMLKFTLYFLQKVESWIRPRWFFLCGRKSFIIFGLVIFAMACIMILPIPLTNTLPAMIIFFMAIGLIESDGLVCALALCLGLLALSAYTFTFYLFCVHGLTALLAMKERILHFFVN